MATPFTLKKELCDIGKLLYKSGMLAGSDGNISAKLDDDRIMVTPSGAAKGRMNPDDLVIVDQNGKHLQGVQKASSELLMHLEVYKNRPDIGACVHSHAPYATSFAVAGIELAGDILPEVVLFIGGIPLTDYAPPGTDAVPKSIEPHLDGNNAFLLRNHGLLTIGHTLEEAYNRHEIVEHYAKIVHLSRQLGNINAIPSDDFKRLEKMRTRLDDAWNGNK
ncbi:MAG: class II aldolase/adducin family protein [Calditrichaeota bacterium]|nr:MAG: class II aldolase/adducin family protein [Calditrichota bacterium]